MRYAFFSDIHGNLSALEEGLGNAAKQNIDEYFMLGDYYADLPYPNEVVEVIRNMANATVIGGNKEKYLVDLSKQEQSSWTHEQMMPLYWNYRTLKKENLDYLMGLPKQKTLDIGDGKVLCLNHESKKVLGDHIYSSAEYACKMKDGPFTHSGFLKEIKRKIEQNENIKKRLDELPDGIYAFGHSHLQWHVEMGGKLLINAGSCGMPLDFDTRASYTIVEWKDNQWTVEERRVMFDVERVKADLKASGLYREAQIWSEIMLDVIGTGEEKISHFLRYVGQLERRNGGQAFPYENRYWRLAGRHWRLI